MLAVSWAYTIVCRSFPDGGGVYTAARRLSPTLSVIGATLLLSGYIMTAAISAIEAFHYFGTAHHLVVPLGVAAIVLIGGLNWLGARSAGRFALVIAFAALGVSASIALLAIPHFIDGVDTISLDYFRQTPTSEVWVKFTKICLALAGVEAVANMTGLMKQPVGREAKRTIWPVSAEVVGLNIWFGLALAGLGFVVAGTPIRDSHRPDFVKLGESRAAVVERLPAELEGRYNPTKRFDISAEDLTKIADPDLIERYEALKDHEARVDEYTHASMRVIAQETATDAFGGRIGPVFGTISGVTFGLLLLSATNTAIMAMASVFFAMAQDRELPSAFMRLNYSGVPWVGLVVAILIPALVILFEHDVTILASLYVLGVCGAITVTVLSSAYNRELDVEPWQRACLWALGLLLLAITLTIGVTQPISTAFSGTLVALTLSMRSVLRKRRAPKEFSAPDAGWLPVLRDAAIDIDPNKPRVMLAARGRYQAEYAVDLAKRRGATLFAIFVRPVRVMNMGPGKRPGIESDGSGQEALGTTALLAKDAGVSFVPIYVTSTSIPDEILDYTITYNCDTLIMGKSHRSVFSRRLEGDVVAEIQRGLPEGVTLITRSAETPHSSVPGPDRDKQA
ncbi:MAG: universal stress protein, partial [Planctomycetota bacterium]